MDMLKAQMEFPSTLGPIALISITTKFSIVGYIQATNTGLISVLERTDHLFEMPAQPFACAKSQLESLIAVTVGFYVRFLRLHASERQFKLMKQVIRPMPIHIAALEIGNGLLWVGDRTQSVFYYRFAEDNKSRIVGTSIAVDPEPHAVTAMCIVDASAISVGTISTK
jgi:hypothetical protein